jgi:hypothetical protein
LKADGHYNRSKQIYIFGEFQTFILAKNVERTTTDMGRSATLTFLRGFYSISACERNSHLIAQLDAWRT